MFSASPLVCIHARTGKADSASYHWLDAGRLVDRYVLEASRLRARIMCRDGGGAQAMDPSKPGRFMVASDAEEVYANNTCAWRRTLLAHNLQVNLYDVLSCAAE